MTLALLPSISAATTSYTPFSREVCEQGICDLDIHQNPTYYQENNGTWNTFNNSIQTVCPQGIVACVDTNLYRLYIKDLANRKEALSFSYQGNNISFSPISISYNNGTNNIILGTAQGVSGTLNGNTITFSNIFNTNTSLQYTYTPYFLKQYLTINNRLGNQRLVAGATLDYTFRINYTQPITTASGLWNRTGNARTASLGFLNGTNERQFFITRGLAWDNAGSTVEFDYELNVTQTETFLILKVPFSWLQNSTRSYPVTIDPSIYLNNNSVMWDGFVLINSAIEPAVITRDSTSTAVQVGSTFSGLGPVSRRGAVTWNLTQVPQYAQVIGVTMGLTITVAPVTERILRFFHMDGDAFTYADDDTGNTAFFNDMGNGTNYLNQTVTVIGDGQTLFNFTNLSNFMGDFNDRIRSGANNWTIGIRNQENNGVGDLPARFSSVETGVDVDSLRIRYVVPTIVTLLYPPNATTFTLQQRGTITLNFTVQNEQLNNTVWLFGDNTTPVSYEHMLVYNFTTPNSTMYSYNWTVPLARNFSDVQLLHHFDNNSFYKENNTHYYDFSGAHNYSLIFSQNVRVNYSNEIHAGVAAFTGGEIVTRCGFECYSMRNATYMVWLKTMSTSSTQGIMQNYAFGGGGTSLGFSILKTGSAVNVFTNADVNIIDPTFFVGKTGRWVHLAVTTRANNTISIYKDGELTNTSQGNGVFDLTAFGFNFTIGDWANNANNPWNGSMEDLVIINRTLDPAEINQYIELQAGSYFWYVNATTTDSNFTDQYQFNSTISETRVFYITEAAAEEFSTLVYIITIGGAVAGFFYSLDLLKAPEKKKKKREVDADDLGD